ncbi:MAG: protein translocase subunit SecF, partial [Acidobacteriota bacterium]
AVGIAVVGMILYLAYVFRSMKGTIAPWKLGVAAVYALVHDLIFVTGVFTIFGRLWGAPLDILFVTAQLAILGYSANDSIVIFHRLQQEWQKARGKTLLAAINDAITSSLTRSFNTSFTTLLVLLALLVFGGSTIRWFVLTLTIGTVVGAYSSLFVAPPFLYYLTVRRKVRT